MYLDHNSKIIFELSSFIQQKCFSKTTRFINMQNLNKQLCTYDNSVLIENTKRKLKEILIFSDKNFFA